MNLPLFIARRISQPSEENRRGIMVLFATVAVALSLAVMLLSMAVIMGFKAQVESKFTSFSGDVIVGDIRSLNTSESYPITDSESIRELIGSVAQIESISRYALKGGIAKTDSSIEGLLLKGVDSSYDMGAYEEWLVEGRLPSIVDSLRNKDILISEYTARKLDMGVGDKFEMLFIDQTLSPRRDRFKIVGIYNSGVAEIDLRNAITDLRNVQRLMDWSKEQISGYEIRLPQETDAQEFASQCNFELLYSTDESTLNMVANSIYELYPAIFDWLRTHDVNAAVILGVMLTVALFNMVSVLLILVLERRRMIGIMRAMGMSNRNIGRIFLYRSMIITTKGVAWGNIVALTLCLAQKYLHIIKLDSSGYILSEVPISIDLWWWLAINVGAVVVIAITLTLPARIVANISPEESIRYQ